MTTFFIQPGTMSFEDLAAIERSGNLAVETLEKSMWGMTVTEAPKGGGMSVRETLALEALKLLWSSDMAADVKEAVKIADDLLAELNAVKEKELC